MRIRLSVQALAALLVLLLVAPAFGAPHAPLSDTAYDGGVLSTDILGRGGSYIGMGGSPEGASANPASLIQREEGSILATAQVGMSSELPEATVRATHPLGAKVLQYIAIGADRGVAFFEPISRVDERQVNDLSTPETSYRDVQNSANAIGFAGAAPWGKASLGLSIAYLYSATSVTEHEPGQEVVEHFDTGNGVRLNMGLQVPTGPVMWGIVAQNMPGIIWNKYYHRETLPMKIRIGTAWKAGSLLVLSAESEVRFYNEGGETTDYAYLGADYVLTKNLRIRSGVFGEDIYKAKTRHVTGGVKWTNDTGANFGYAMDSYEEDNQRIRVSYVTFQAPLAIGGQ